MFRPSALRFAAKQTPLVVPKPKRRFKPFLLYTVGVVGAIYGVDKLLWDSTLARTAKGFYTLSLIGLDYKLNFKEGSDIPALHERSADRLFNLLNDNKGLYIKLGQNIANQSAIFPKPFQEKFARLYDSAATDPWEKVEAILKEELGADYRKYFKSIDKTPIASASVAQVHRGVFFSGEEVAVKVQHYYIANQIDMDLFTYKFFTNIFSKSFEIPLSFMSDYISERLKEEVDFRIEYNNGERTRKLIQDDDYLKKKIHVPINYKELCTKRVLTSEWCEGEALIRYNDLKTRYNTKEIMYDYLKLFSKMIFEWGFIHSDPHPGNLLVRHNAITKRQELVLLDHGLYVEFPETLRYQYCSLWKSLFELNDKELKKIATSWGIGSEQSDMFATFQLLKPYNKESQKFLNMKDFEREEKMKNNFKQFFANTEKFPLELIFLGRTVKMVQLLNQKYRAPVNRINLFTEEAVRGFYLNPPKVETTSYWVKSEKLLRFGIFKATMALSNLGFYLTKFTQYIFGTKNIEDLLQETMNQHMRNMGVENPDNIDIFSG